MNDYQYNQEIKNISREKLITHAIKCLTIEREKSYLLNKEHLSRITDHFNSLLFRTKEWNNLGFDFRNQYNWLFWGGKESWSDFYECNCIPKSANDLKVLYLSGPEPYNDIDVLCNNGIRLENIWAIESDRATYEKAIESLINAGIQIKIHRGNLSEFFELTNHEFDIVYFDACSPIFSAQQSPLETLKQLFLNKRLSGLSALITNFSEPGSNYDWDKIFAVWFGTRESLDNPAPDGEFGGIAEKTESYEKYCQFINSHLPEYYDKFLTSFIATLGSEIIPMWQLTSLSSIQSNHLLNESLILKKLKSIREYEFQAESIKDFLTNVQHYLLDIDNYPLLNWARIIRETFPSNHFLNNFLNNKRRNITIEDALYIGSFLKCFENGDTQFNTFVHKICGERLKETLMNLDFFDRHMRITCDAPMKNLLVELFIGLYGYPYIAHAGKSLSLKYKAKETWMYSNVFIFDQCRYLYDFLPTLDLWENFFQNLANQVIIRGCIDGIRRNHFQLNTSLFKWGFIEDLYNQDFEFSIISNRTNLNVEI